MFLGIDTSCYTTSIAVVDNNNKLVVQKKKILNVKNGLNGLRQSDAFFQHIKNLPSLISDISNIVDFSKISCISISEKPRPNKKSYMPVFISGQNIGQIMAITLNIPLKKFSHQEGHIMSALWDTEALYFLYEEFLVFHISGGTTEILRVNKCDDNFKTELLGGTKDIYAGQLIDRIGVNIELEFPCGYELEKLAIASENKVNLPVCVNESWMNFSGPETKSKKYIQEGIKKEEIALGIIDCITISVEKVMKNVIDKTEINKILMVGGVCSSSILRKHIINQFSNYCDIRFAKPEFSTDNAVGTALLGKYF